MYDYLSALLGPTGTSQVETTESKTPRTQMTQAEELRLKQMYTGKKVTKADMERALNEPSSVKVIKTLLEKSPLGVKCPEGSYIEGYVLTRRTDMAGADFFESNDGGLIRVVDGGVDSSDRQPDGTTSVTYTKGSYTQRMLYDENGTLKSGKMEFKDEYGSTEKKIFFSKLQNGKFEILTYSNDGHSFETCELLKSL